MQRVLTAPSIKARIGALAVGLAADCDNPEQAIDTILHANLPNANMLPFVAFLTCDGQWINGASGYQDVPQLLALLDAAEKSPVREAKPEVQKALAKPAAAATAAAAKSDWKAVLVAAREEKKSSGRCAERDAIRTAEKAARDWAAAEFAAVVQGAAAGDDLVPLRKRLTAVKQQFAGEPEAADAENGFKALQRLQVVREVEAAPNPARDLRTRSAEPWKGTRWTAIFERPAKPSAGK